MAYEGSDYDLIVLGAGIAGLTTALSATEAGLRVAILEKQPDVGGSSAMSGGYFAFCGTDYQEREGVVDSREVFLDDLRKIGNGESDERLLEAYLDNQHDAYEWLVGKGVEFVELELSAGQSIPRGHLSRIREVVKLLRAEFEAKGGALFLEHRAVALDHDDAGLIATVVADTPDGRATFTSRLGVVIAAGGFSRSTELLKIFAPAQLESIRYGGLGNTGDGLKLGWKLGAGLADMSHIAGMYGSHPDTGSEFHELLTAFYLGGIIVNRRGERFANEETSYKAIAVDSARQPEGLGFQIFDAPIRAQAVPGVPLRDIDKLEDIGHVFKADTLAELAEVAGIDPEGLAATVETYNAFARGETEDEFGRIGLVNGIGTPVEIRTGPFYAYPAKALLTSTYCGLTITPNAEVTDVDGEVIPGLFAVGEVTGGFHGAAYMAGTSLGKGAVFGRILARHIASLASERATAAL